MPTTTTVIGYIASGLVLTTFWTNDLRRLRILAILSNIAFISYGALVWLPPVLGLHLLLLLLNTVRLMGMPRGGARRRSARASGVAVGDAGGSCSTQCIRRPRFAVRTADMFPHAVEFVEQRLRLFEVGRAEALGKPAVDGRKQVARLVLPALVDRKSTRLNSSHEIPSRMPSSA